MLRRRENLALACATVAVSLQLILADPVLFCVHNEDERSECRRLRSIPPLDVDCAKQADPATCLEFACVIAADCRVEIREERADIMMASALGLWYLDRDFSEVYAPVVAENRGPKDLEQRQEGLTYKAVAIATKGKCDLRALSVAGPLTLVTSKNLRSCHGEYGDLAGWVAPIARMKKDDLSRGTTDIDLVVNWFDTSCAPSNSDGGVCSGCSEDHNCDLDDPYATPLGVIKCLRDNAADIGFVDHWTAMGAGQSDDGGAADMSDLQVVCSDGCRDLSSALEANCYLAKVPADVAIMRGTDVERLKAVRNLLLQAGNSTQFQETFGTSSNLNGALFSHGTSKLDAVHLSAKGYLGGLDSTLTQFSELFQDSTDLPQPGVSDGTLVREVKRHPGWAVGITFLSALALGMMVGLGLTTLICRRRRRHARHQTQYLDKDTYVASSAIASTRGTNRMADDHTYVDES